LWGCFPNSSGQLSHLQYAIVNLPAGFARFRLRISQRGHILRLFLYPRQGAI